MLWFIGILLLLAIFVIDAVSVTKPAPPPARGGNPVPTRPQAADVVLQDPSLPPVYAERRAAYLRWLLEQPTPDERGGVWVDAGKLAAGAKEINPRALEDALAFVNAHKDPSDFTVAGLVRLFYLPESRSVLTASQSQAVKEALLNFKYWFDQAGYTEVEMWTENHQILNHSNEYLAGQAFPDEVFPGSGMTGAEHLQAARGRILRWIDWHARTGFAEWDSVVYYPEDLAPLLNLLAYAGDEEIATRAAMMVDAILFDIAVDSYKGFFATSHGRATANSIKSAAGDSLVTVQALGWGLGRFQSAGMAPVALAATPGYTVPEVIQALAQDLPETYENFERHSIPLTRTAAKKYGLNFQNGDDLWAWWGMGAFTSPPVIARTIQAADEWNLWHYPDFADLKDLAKVLQRLRLLGAASALLDPQSNGVLMSEVNKVTYRTPDYILSTAQDYRKGEKGYQQHISQAALGPYAVVFTSNPDSLREDDSQRPSYWASSGRLPRAAQYRTVSISLYNIARHPSPKPLEPRHYAFTHAYFPRWAFDRVEEVAANGPGSWIIGQKGSGYIALYSYQPYTWTELGPDAGQEIIALGRRNVWITQAGREAVDGSFADFVSAVAAARVNINGLRVAYDAPGLGEVNFAWDGPLTVGGENVPLREYPRWKNPYTVVAFNSLRYEIAFQGKRLTLDFGAGTREE